MWAGLQFAVDLRGAVGYLLHQGIHLVALGVEEGQVLGAEVVGDEKLFHLLGEGQGLPGHVHEGAVVAAVPGVQEGW